MRRVSHISDLHNKAPGELPGFSGAVQAVAHTALIEYQAPATGFSLTAADNTNTLILEPAGTLATGTVTTPASPANNQVFNLASTAIVTLLTVLPNAGQTIKGLLTTIAANGFASWVYRASNTTWYRIG